MRPIYIHQLYKTTPFKSIHPEYNNVSFVRQANTISFLIKNHIVLGLISNKMATIKQIWPGKKKKHFAENCIMSSVMVEEQ